MRTRPLGTNGPELSVVGLGTWALGGSWEFGWGAHVDDESLRAIRAAPTSTSRACRRTSPLSTGCVPRRRRRR